MPPISMAMAIRLIGLPGITIRTTKESIASP
jgi:hypothetical protein